MVLSMLPSIGLQRNCQAFLDFFLVSMWLRPGGVNCKNSLAGFALLPEFLMNNNDNTSY